MISANTSRSNANTVISHYFIEGVHYTENDLKKAQMQMSEEDSTATLTSDSRKITSVIESLCAYKFTSDKSSSVTSALEDHNEYYVFNFVGILVIYDYVFFVFPKFIKSDSENKFISPTQTARELMQLVVATCEQYQRRQGLGTKDTGPNADSDSGSVSTGELYRALLQDYVQDGAYASRMRIQKQRGNGTIDWQQTISRTIPFLTENNEPVYIDYISRDYATDTEALIRRIQLAWVAKAAQWFQRMGLLEDILRLPHALCAVSQEQLDDIGNTSYIRSVLIHARNRDFATRNNKLINILLMLTDRDERHEFNTKYAITHLGSAPFHNIWEDVCRKIFNGKSIDSEGAPVWRVWGKERKPQQQNLIPDAVCKLGESNDIVIIDAKYYTPQPSGNGIANQPGNYDVVKEYMYQLLIDNYYAQQGTVQANAFIFPERFTIGNAPSKNLYRVQGDVRLEFLTGYKLDRKQQASDEACFANEFLPITYVELNPIRAFRVYTNTDSINRDEELQRLIRTAAASRRNDVAV